MPDMIVHIVHNDGTIHLVTLDIVEANHKADEIEEMRGFQGYTFNCRPSITTKTMEGYKAVPGSCW